jgi:hypothetical protein
MRKSILLFVSLFATSLAAQPLTVGTQITDYGSGISLAAGGAPVSFVDLTNIATAAGTVNEASVSWTQLCSGAFKIVFLRSGFASASAFTVVAVRGPFNAVQGRNEVALSPPVTLQKGDLIGVVQLQPYSTCGSIQAQFLNGSGYNVTTTGDISTTGVLGSVSSYVPGYQIAALAYNTSPVLVRILPAAGAVQGASAFFRTSVQMLNPGVSPITGKFVFHPQGQSAKPTDPSLPFTIGLEHTYSSPDLITAMGTSGLGSIDVMTNGGALPVVSARVFSDGGAAGTSGFSEEGVSPNDALDSGSTGLLLIPADLTNFRMNIGVRTLDAGATIGIVMFDANGNIRASRTVSYPANYFEQKTASEFTGATTVEPAGWISINTSAGRIIIYSSVIDNRTSDSTYHLANVK